MKRFTSSIRKSVQDGNLFAALFVSLAVPDICGALQDPQAGVRERYRAWFERYLKPRYDPQSQFEYLCVSFPQAVALMPPEAVAELKAPFDPALSFSADDCYRCRCKCLHEGVLEKSGKERFIFITPMPNGIVLHKNLRNGQLVLQIDIFSEDICLAVESWEKDVQNDTAVATRIAELITFTEWFNL